MLETIEIKPKLPAKTSVIWLHGLGADGYDFAGIVPQLALPEKLAARFIFPHAPLRPISFANGSLMRAWFDLSELSSAGANTDGEGICDSQKLISELIDIEISRGIPSEKIILAGFSQGAAMALQCGLRYPEKLAGVLALSGFLLMADKLEKEKNAANQNTQILMMHGTSDHIIKPDWAQHSYDKLIALGFNAKWRTYPMQHEVCAEEIRDISNWLREHLDY